MTSRTLCLMLVIGASSLRHPAVADGAVIHDIQGSAHRSPLVGMTVGGVPGIVTQVVSNGFFMQDPNPDADPATSEGVFVFTSSAPTVVAGDAVQITGTVLEFRLGGASGTNLSLTELTAPTVQKLSTGNPLPAAAVIGAGGRVPPGSVIEDDATGSVETSGTFDPDTDGIDFYESLEGMRVQLGTPLVVGPTVRFGSGAGATAELYVVGDGGTAAGLRSPRGGLVVQATDFNPERLVVADLGTSIPDAKVGDGFAGPIVGVLDYNFGTFRIRPAGALPALVLGSLPKESTPLAAGPGQVSVASYNAANLSPTDPQARFDGIAAAIANNLMAPAIVSVEEIQDNSGAVDDGIVAADQTIGKLLAALDAAGVTYQARWIDPVNDLDGGAPGANIRQVILFRPDLVTFVDIAGGTSTSTTTVVGSPGAPTLSASPGRIDPTNAAFATSRKPLVGQFVAGGQTLFVVANHFNAKGGDNPLFGQFQPPVLASETQRVQQATVVKDFVQSLLAANAGARVVVMGDLNDYQFSNPITVLKTAPLTDLIETLPAAERYTYDFQGNSQVLDHILVSDAFAAGSVDVVHLNSEYPAADRLSDHDPMVALLVLDANPSCTMGAGLPQTPPKPPKNAGLVKIGKGLTPTPALKGTKLTISGTLENCRNFPVMPGSAGPITGGAFKLSLEVPPGSTCAAITAGFPVKSALSITWNTPNPTKPGKLKKVGSEKTTLASYSEPGVDPLVLGVVSQDFGPKSKTPGFMTKHAVMSFTMDQNAAQIAMGCADPKKGLAMLNFTGMNGPSTLEIQ